MMHDSVVQYDSVVKYDFYCYYCCISQSLLSSFGVFSFFDCYYSYLSRGLLPFVSVLLSV